MKKIGIILLALVGIGAIGLGGSLALDRLNKTVGEVISRGYQPEPHEIWKLTYVNNDESGNEISSGSGNVIKYTVTNEKYTFEYLENGEVKTVELIKGEDFSYIEIEINYDMLD